VARANPEPDVVGDAEPSAAARSTISFLSPDQARANEAETAGKRLVVTDELAAVHRYVLGVDEVAPPRIGAGGAGESGEGEDGGEGEGEAEA
jgi:hypothetical protein